MTRGSGRPADKRPTGAQADTFFADVAVAFRADPDRPRPASTGASRSLLKRVDPTCVRERERTILRLKLTDALATLPAAGAARLLREAADILETVGRRAAVDHLIDTSLPALRSHDGETR